MRFPLLTKFVILAAVLVALLSALEVVDDIVDEREGRLREAQASVATSLASAQAIAGPVLQRECTESWDVVTGEGKDRRMTTDSRGFSVMAAPATLSIDGFAAIDPRRRGIYKVNGYTLKAAVAARWSDLRALQPERSRPGSRLSCGAPFAWVSVSDVRGIRAATVTARGRDLVPEPGTGHGFGQHGFHVALAPLWPQGDLPPADTLQLDLQLEFAGTGELAIAPVGLASTVKLRSDWPHPSFNGRFLPNTRSVETQGFEATWEVSALASSAPRDVLGSATACGLPDPRFGQPATPPNTPPCAESFGVSFIDPVNIYVLSDRATKYGLLFIVLTFVAVAMVEALRRLRVHPIQYLLVGSALVVFFLLLVSLSEHQPFAVAYASAAGACTALLAFYGSYVLGGWRAGLAFGGAIGALYGVLYVLLQQEQTSLVLGSLLLFAVLAAVMVLTRKLDWYALIAQWRVQVPAVGGDTVAAAR